MEKAGGGGAESQPGRQHNCVSSVLDPTMNLRQPKRVDKLPRFQPARQELCRDLQSMELFPHEPSSSYQDDDRVLMIFA